MGWTPSCRNSCAPRRRAGCNGWRASGSSCRCPPGSVVGDRVVAVGHGRLADDVVDEPVLEGLLRGEPAVAVGVLVDLLHRLARVERLQLVELTLRPAEQIGLDRDVRRRAADTGGG